MVPGAGAPDGWGPGGIGPAGGPSFVAGAAPAVIASGVVPPGSSDGPPGAPPPFTPGGSPGAAPLVPTPVPEPQTWALMLAGLAALALACRRRNKVSERDVGGAVAGAVCAAGGCRAGACADPAQAASD